MLSSVRETFQKHKGKSFSILVQHSLVNVTLQLYEVYNSVTQYETKVAFILKKDERQRG